jgi:hypothetical protein
MHKNHPAPEKKRKTQAQRQYSLWRSMKKLVGKLRQSASNFITKNIRDRIRNKRREKILKIISERDAIILDELRDEILKMVAFQTAPVRENSVLLVEANNFHGEVMPAMAHYFGLLGFSVDVLVNNNGYALEPFCRMHTDTVNIYHADLRSIANMLRLKKLTQYEYIVFNSRLLIDPPPYKKRIMPFDEYFTGMAQPKKARLSIEHKLEYLPADANHIMILETFPHDETMDKHVVYPFYLGDTAITDRHSGLTKFVAIGNFDRRQRNHQLLFDGIRKLADDGRTDFEVILIGRYGQLNIPPDLSDMISVYSNAPYEDIYSRMEDADYFLPLLDSSVPTHRRYLSHGTSGSTQLVYTFAKPCLIEEAFAERFSYNAENSIIYKDGTGFYEALKTAMDITPDAYRAMQEKLIEVRDRKLAQSLENLSGMLNKFSH